MKKLTMLLLLVMVLLCSTVAHGQEQAEDITPGTTIYGSGYDSFWFLTDKDMTGCWSGWNPSFTIESPTPIGSLYIMMDYNYGTYTVTDPETGNSANVKQNYLHQYVDLVTLLGYAPAKVELSFISGHIGLCEMEIYGPGEPPAHVQRWQEPWEGETDILLFSAHGDDEQLYFAGLLPLYAGQKRLNVQVVYMTDHRGETYLRTHEMLNGLWAVGVRAYPVFGWFADFIHYNMEQTYLIYEEEYDTTWATLQGFVVEQLRRFKPQVAVGHDIYGEYGHGMHKVFTDLLISAVPMINNPESFPKSAQRWGTWELPKLYLHLYWGRTLTMNYDLPLTAFNGMTAFEVSQKLGFPCHKTQQVERFTTWFYGENNEITRCDQIELYNPAKYGLYHTLVGDDELKTDLMEHLTPHAYTRRRPLAEAALLALEPPPVIEPAVPFDPYVEDTEPTEVPTEPAASPAPTAPRHPLWIDITGNVLILAAAVTVLVVGSIKLKKSRSQCRPKAE